MAVLSFRHPRARPEVPFRRETPIPMDCRIKSGNEGQVGAACHDRPHLLFSVTRRHDPRVHFAAAPPPHGLPLALRPSTGSG